ncbi:hypothetical protein KOR42_39240 [Thalassoglobus neptunius]|uniref:Uncharacterized protein n=1 Tax=Thalassoglobus neptunius TaxID=1938619 RepID=A0A5C5WDM3_9PLAN|nr:hypothetical protein [Thalassoglobus neptunius]TWT49008.1 hypothetical protein KOR42_39240 [Thalassoglobus neptunius]
MSDLIRQSNRDHDRNPYRALVVQGKGSSSCEKSIRMIVTGTPTAGTITLGVTLVGIWDTITFPWNGAATPLRFPTGINDAFAAHAGWNASTDSMTILDGPLPDNSIQFRPGGRLNFDNISISTDSNTLTGGAGMGVRIERANGS